MKPILLTLLSLLATGSLFAQVMFEEEIHIDNYEPTEVVLPPSPLTLQPIFIGGYDIVQSTNTYGNPAGRAIAKEWHDFIGFTPDSSGESMGWISVSHEMVYRDDRLGDGGGMTTFRIKEVDEDSVAVLYQRLDDGREGYFFNVDFVNTVGETGMNCAGISAPNGRIWTAEEWWRGSNNDIWAGNTSAGGSLPVAVQDGNGDLIRSAQGVRDTASWTIDAPEFAALGIDGMTISKHQNFNYMVEIDPKQAKAIRKQYNWGRAGWEGGAITANGMYAYLGDDATPAPLVRVAAKTPWDFTDVSVQVFKEDNPAGTKWIEIPRDASNVFEDISAEAWKVGATMYVRNEWVDIDQETGIVYWAETGRVSGSSGPGLIFNWVRDEYPDVKPAAHHNDWAQVIGVDSAMSVDYQDHYGRVNFYDPSTDETGVVIQGGPYFPTSPSELDYPDKHLSNPDGLKIMNINGEKYLLISEDLNQTSYGSMPDGISNPMCEMYLLPIDARNASTDELIRLTAVPRGAEITGAIQVSSNTILFNSQHPSAQNSFPYNHSITLAMHGFDQVTSGLTPPSEEELERFQIYPNPTTRMVYLNEKQDFAIYNIQGQRMRVYRDTQEIDVSGLTPATYIILCENGSSYKLIVQ